MPLAAEPAYWLLAGFSLTGAPSPSACDFLRIATSCGPEYGHRETGCRCGGGHAWHARLIAQAQQIAADLDVAQRIGERPWDRQPGAPVEKGPYPYPFLSEPCGLASLPLNTIDRRGEDGAGKLPRNVHLRAALGS